MPEEVLWGKAIVLSESKDRRSQYTLLLKQKKTIKTRTMVDMEAERTDIIKELTGRPSAVETSFLKSKINLYYKKSMKAQAELTHVFTEIVVMI